MELVENIRLDEPSDGPKDGRIYFKARSNRKGEGQVEFKVPVSENQPPKESRRCPHCQGEMQCIEKQDRPSWRELFYGPTHPGWFEWTSRGQCSPADEGPDEPLGSELNAEGPGDEEPNPDDTEESGWDIFDEIIASRSG